MFAKDVDVKRLSVEAQMDADRKTRDRSALPVLWAVPREGKRSRGQFWAFFPTETETSLTGIVNAPWKTNADRQNLLDGPFNRALLKETVRLVSTSLAALYRRDDPGYLLDLLPTRASDAAGWADAALIEELEAELVSVECVPNTFGKLQHTSVVQMRPDVALSGPVGDLLSGPDGELSGAWVHKSVEKRERRAKAERIGVKKALIKAWLKALAEPLSPASSVRAIIAAGVVEKELPRSQVDELRDAEIILTEAGGLVSAKSPSLLLPRADEPGEANDLFVHRVVAADPQARNVLRTLKVPEQSAASYLNSLLSGYRVDWGQAWSHLRELSLVDAVTILAKHASRHTLHVKTLAGDYKPLRMTLLPGQIVPASGERDAGVCIDLDSHRDDGDLLRKLEATEIPLPGRDQQYTPWFNGYLHAAIIEFCARLQKAAARPRWDLLSFGEYLTAGPLDPLTVLSEEGRVRMTLALVPHLTNERSWVLRHQTRPEVYPPLECVPPIRWMLQKHGRLSTSLGTKDIPHAVSSTLAAWSQILPVATLDAASSSALKLPDSLKALSALQWTAGFTQIQHVSDERLVGGFYRAAAEIINPAPALLWCRQGEDTVARPPSTIHLASDAETAQAHRTAGVPSVIVPDRKSVELLVDRWGMQRAAGTVRYVATSDETPLTDAFPGLRRYLSEADWQTPMQRCDDIWFESIGEDATGVVGLQFARVGDRLCFLTNLVPFDLVRHIAADLEVTLSNDQVQDVLDYARREARQRAVEVARASDDVSEKLVSLMDAATLLNGLPAGVQSILVERREHRSAQHVARTALAVYGVEVLPHYAEALARAGLEPPSRWGSSPRAQEFVDELGFPAEYAGFQRLRRDPTLDVDGPIELKPLHEFQKSIGRRIQDFIQKSTPERGLLSLPTGSGKTRVVVQAIVESMERGEFDGSVVWVAQSDELCEQAVQSWAQVWRAFGPRRRLRISRLWGQTNNRVVEAIAPHIVIATYQSLASRLRSPSYAWLLDATCIIIDEAHGSIALSYTDILDSFGLTARNTARPLIGLTATPFRSAADPAETQWLVNRYGKQRFDHDVISGDDPYPVLQGMGVLARVDQQVLEGGDLTLTEAELAELIQFKRIPASAESRLGQSEPRNTRLIESIKTLPSDWPVLLFATSVEHAHLMAALLSMEGVSAKAISGATDPGARRHYIEEFRQGRIRVLSNYNVLSTGFDAPSLRALYIARPVFSPVLYQQMLGRGLRGPLNGGKERCLVVNVQDNIAQFGEQLAFRHFEYLWKGESTV
ncbi:DEAD/DEAH box helicase [Undibacterium arcticum]|uniref:DEAD/DEAH box helicase n=1 Tax=Undibacterium arcticum TaxID=1762892 RepID=UPI003622A5E6